MCRDRAVDSKAPGFWFCLSVPGLAHCKNGVAQFIGALALTVSRGEECPELQVFEASCGCRTNSLHERTCRLFLLPALDSFS